MTRTLKYRFGSKEINGRNYHFFVVGTPYEMLGTICASYLSDIKEVVMLIADLERVINGTMEDCGWGQDACSFTSEAHITYINYDFDQHTITISTTEIIELLRDWLTYLQQQAQSA